MILRPCALTTPLLGLMPVRRARRQVQDQWREAQRRGPAPGGVRRLFVDVSVIVRGDAGTGIQRVVRSVLRRLLDHPPAGHEVVPVAGSKNQPYQRADLSGLFPGIQPTPVTNRVVAPACGDTFLALDLSAHVLPFHWNQLLQWKRAGVSVQAVVYDLLPVLHPDWFTPRAAVHFRRWLKTLAVFADRLHCISRVVMSDLTTWFGQHYAVELQAADAAVFPMGSDIPAEPAADSGADAAGALAFARRRPTVLVVGTIEPRKGHADVLDAFEGLWARGVDAQLLLVGAPGWKTEPLQQRLRSHPRAGDTLLWVEGASDAELVALYQAVNGVIVASEAEGLGLPILEALGLGVPVLARDIAVFREAAAEHACYFPNAVGGLTPRQLQDWLANEARPGRPHLRRRQPSWADCTDALVANMALDAGRR